MKNPVPTSARSPLLPFGFHSVFNVTLLFAAGVVSAFSPVARAQANDLEIGVRTKVIDKEHIWAKTNQAAPGAGGHGKVYGILAVAQVKSAVDLLRPVDETMILRTLSAEMNKNGFQLYQPGQKPEIIITASYGRGELQNPYIRGAGETGADGRAGSMLSDFFVTGKRANAVIKYGVTGLTNDSGAATSVIDGGFSQQILDEKAPGYEANLQKAATEKLYIRVAAWEYPTGRKATPKMLWKTIMVVDDPEDRDLNVVAAKMLEAGAPYFDREIRDPEASIHTQVPTGTVNVGSPEVIEPSPKKG